MRYVLQIAYDGTNYAGWQRQPNALSIQQVIEESLIKLLKQQIYTTGCGRTDAGVHARDFYLNFDYDSPLPENFILKLNGILPCDIAAHHCFEVSTDFNSRFDAKLREYRYFISTTPDAFIHNRAFLFTRKLNVGYMNQACELLLYHKSFGCFCKTGGGNNTNICYITEARWYKRGNKLVFKIKADRFLRNMVRAIVGTLLLVGEEKISLADFQEILNSEDRSRAGQSAPAFGLYLWKITYEHF